MSSTFIPADPKVVKESGLFNSIKPQPIYMQFVPGIVKYVVVNEESLGYTSSRDINSIFASSHAKETINWSGAPKTQYFPLFRGMVDVPITGDQVLLCTVGGINYYLGPINTANKPNYNIDHLHVMDTPGAVLSSVQYTSGEKITNRDLIGLSNNFPITPTARLQKIFKNELDNPSQLDQSVPDIHGDMLLEGRHGNSIRIGSRNVDPYIFISNGRNYSQAIESTRDGSLIAMTKQGSLKQHFTNELKKDPEKDVMNDYEFTISSDYLNKDNKFQLGDTFYNYNYDDDQMLITSKRITIDSKRDSLFLSSKQNTVLSSGNDLRLHSTYDIKLNASRILIGGEMAESSLEVEPLVRGKKLKETLLEIINILKSFKQAGCIAGLSGPPAPDTLGSLIDLEVKLNEPDFLSDIAFIESENR